MIIKPYYAVLVQGRLRLHFENQFIAAEISSRYAAFPNWIIWRTWFLISRFSRFLIY